MFSKGSRLSSPFGEPFSSCAAMLDTSSGSFGHSLLQQRKEAACRRCDKTNSFLPALWAGRWSFQTCSIWKGTFYMKQYRPNNVNAKYNGAGW